MELQELVSVLPAPPFPSAPSAPPAPSAPVLVPDLLHPAAALRIDVEHTKLAVALAFAAGVSGGVFSEALDKAAVAPSTWQPESFANDLFLQQFVALCFKVRINGHDLALSSNHLVKLLGNPPSDPAIVVHRRLIFAEIEMSPDIRALL
jgi:DNA mismatch repair protein MutS2